MDELLTDEGLILKERLRAARDTSRLLTNQEIADRAGLSLSTVNNYFSNRSKASPAATVGRLCMVLHVSMDEVFGIVPDGAAAPGSEHLEQIAGMEKQCEDLRKEAAHREEIIAMKDETIKNYQLELQKRRPIIWALLVLCILLVVLFAAYILYFDVANPNYGLFQ